MTGVVGDVEQHHHMLPCRVQIQPDAVPGRLVLHGVVQYHDDQAWDLRCARIVELEPRHDVGFGLHAEERRALADHEQLTQVLGVAQDFCIAGLDVGVSQAGTDEIPVVLVLARHRQTDGEVVVLVGEVQLVEPVTRVVGVPVHGLGAQQVAASMEEGHALGQHGEVQPQVLRPHTVGLRGRQGQLVRVDVEKRLVVVLVDVDDLFLGILGIASGAAVVVHLGAGHQVAVAVDELVVGQVAGQAHADLIGGEHQLVEGGHRCRGIQLVGVVPEAADEALVLDQIVAAVEGAAATHGVAQAVAEGADAGARHVELGGVDAPGVVGHFAEVPALTVEVDAGVDGIDGLLHLEHVGLHVVAHEVEAEAVDAVLGGPERHRVDHELLHHGVLGGGVGAAGARLHYAFVVEAIVVARHDLVEDRLLCLARSRWCGCRPHP